MSEWIKVETIPGYAITGDPGDLSRLILIPPGLTERWIAVVETEEGTIQARYLRPEEEYLLGDRERNPR